jgi:hypothetical protein
MRDSSNDRTIERDNLRKWRFLIRNMRRLCEHIRPNLPVNFNDYIGGDVVSSCRRPNSFRIRRFIEAIGLSLVGAKEREDPLHAFLIIDQIDLFNPILRKVELFRKIPFDNVAWHEETPFSTVLTPQKCEPNLMQGRLQPLLQADHIQFGRNCPSLFR